MTSRYISEFIPNGSRCVAYIPRYSGSAYIACSRYLIRNLLYSSGANELASQVYGSDIVVAVSIRRYELSRELGELKHGTKLLVIDPIISRGNIEKECGNSFKVESMRLDCDMFGCPYCPYCGGQVKELNLLSQQTRDDVYTSCCGRHIGFVSYSPYLECNIRQRLREIEDRTLNGDNVFVITRALN